MYNPYLRRLNSRIFTHRHGEAGITRFVDSIPIFTNTRKQLLLFYWLQYLAFYINHKISKFIPGGQWNLVKITAKIYTDLSCPAKVFNFQNTRRNKVTFKYVDTLSSHFLFLKQMLVSWPEVDCWTWPEIDCFSIRNFAFSDSSFKYLYVILAYKMKILCWT